MYQWFINRIRGNSIIPLVESFHCLLNTGFRNHMLNSIKDFSRSNKNGLFINSCFAHCQTERQDTWFSDNSPVIENKVSIELIHISYTRNFR